jgi:serine/threonine-protein kinase
MADPSWTRVKDVIEAASIVRPMSAPSLFCGRAATMAPSERRLQSLLAAIEQAGAFIERPALQSLSVSRLCNKPDTRPRRALAAVRRFCRSREVIEFIGAGGMGEVYRARDAKLNRDVALKVRSEAFPPHSSLLPRFKREAHVLASLNHPNIAAIYGLEESDGVEALVMELVEGPTLASRIAQGPIPINDALSIAKQIAEGLKAALERGIVHRDLKPSNIKVRSDSTVKILTSGWRKRSTLGFRFGRCASHNHEPGPDSGERDLRHRGT